MSQSHWYDTAEHVIRDVLAKLPPGADKRATLEAVDAAYPFGQRSMWPYKKWLEARRQVLHEFNREWFPKKVKEPAGPRLF